MAVWISPFLSALGKNARFRWHVPPVATPSHVGRMRDASTKSDAAQPLTALHAPQQWSAEGTDPCARSSPSSAFPSKKVHASLGLYDPEGGNGTGDGLGPGEGPSHLLSLTHESWIVLYHAVKLCAIASMTSGCSLDTSWFSAMSTDRSYSCGFEQSNVACLGSHEIPPATCQGTAGHSAGIRIRAVAVQCCAFDLKKVFLQNLDGRTSTCRNGTRTLLWRF